MAWYNYALGFRISAAATLYDVNIDKLRVELAAKGTLCEVPKCTGQATTVMLAVVAGLICDPHWDETQTSPSAYAKVARRIITGKQVWLDEQKRIYSEMRTGVAQVVVEVKPGVSILEAAIEANSPVPQLERENIVFPLLPFMP